MLAFIGNLAPTELILIAVVAILIFGKRLPEVAGRAYTELRKIRSNLDRLRAETGIDEELRSIQHSVLDASREASSAIQLDPPSAPTQSRAASSSPEPASTREPSESDPASEPDESEETPADQPGAATGGEVPSALPADRREPSE